jgi:hypothetical protein
LTVRAGVHPRIPTMVEGVLGDEVHGGSTAVIPLKSSGSAGLP